MFHPNKKFLVLLTCIFYFRKLKSLYLLKHNQILLLDENATVTIAHSRTADLPEVTRNADILVVAIGRPKFVTEEMVSEGTVVIDVGVNRDPETGKLCGDVDYAAIEPKASVITPVPGGVGPMTICCLMENTIECFLRKMNS